jgi:4-alpha-glucanotransferase
LTNWHNFVASKKLLLMLGADVVGLNPLHAMFPDRSEEASPYSPSDRTLLNVLYIDVEAVPEFAASEEARRLVSSETFQAALEYCRKSDLVEYAEVARLKMAALSLLFATFNSAKDEKRLNELNAFHRERSALLDRVCVFQALQMHFASQKIQHLNDWLEEYRTYDSSGVKTFADEHPDQVKFQIWLQWIADTQLSAAASATKEMVVGIYRDLAVGVHSSGAEGWAPPGLMAGGVRVGAPPDIWNPAGQNWGLPATIPQRLTQSAYKPFIELLRANMRYAGAIRIDHAMALQRLYWIPQTATAAEGAYVRYPIEDLVRILALESHRHRCLVVGEDLGTVPEGFRERMAEANILSYRVLLFEKDGKAFLAPEHYPALSVSVASSHDLPTLQGWWHERDLDTKARLQLFPTKALAEEARQQRRLDRQSLSARISVDFPQSGSTFSDTNFCKIFHAFLAKTTSLITLVQLDDIAEELDQANVPATTLETPNWRRRQSIALEELSSDPRLEYVARSMKEYRNPKSEV